MTTIAILLLSITTVVAVICICLFLAGNENAALIFMVLGLMLGLFGNGMFCFISTARTDVKIYKPETITRTKSLIVVTDKQEVLSSNDIATYGAHDSLIVIKETREFNQYGLENTVKKEISVK